MALNIKNERAERVARELALETGESLTEAITHALEDRLRQVRAQRRGSSDLDEVRRIAREYRKLPLLDERSPDELLPDLYDLDGLPT